MMLFEAWAPKRDVVVGHAPDGMPQVRSVGGRFLEMCIPHTQIRAIGECGDPARKDCQSQVIFPDNSSVQVKGLVRDLAEKMAYEIERSQVRYTPAEWTNKELLHG